MPPPAPPAPAAARGAAAGEAAAASPAATAASAEAGRAAAGAGVGRDGAEREQRDGDAAGSSGARLTAAKCPRSSTAIATDLERRLEDQAVQVHGNGDGPADARARPEGDVDGAEDLLVLEDVAGQLRALVGADPELGDVPALTAGGVERGQQPLALGLGRGDELAVLDRQHRRLAQRAARCSPGSP